MKVRTTYSPYQTGFTVGSWLLVCVCLFALAGNTQAGGNKLDAQLTQDLFMIERNANEPGSYSTDLLHQAGTPIGSNPVMKVFVHLTMPLDGSIQLLLDQYVVEHYPSSWIPPVGAHTSGFLLCLVASDRIRALAEQDWVVRISSAYRQLKPLNDVAARETNASIAHEQNPPITGAGVRIAILDSGFDLDFPDLPEPVAKMDYADYPDTNADVRDYLSAHGNHVAGTIFGSGELSDGRWRGLAFGADAVLFKIGNDSTTDASTAAVVGAVKGATGWGEADIITMSYGGWEGFNDGSSPEEQAVDWAVGEGVSVLMSAGNSGNEHNHYSGNIAAGATSGAINVYRARSPAESFWRVYLVWDDGEDSIRLSAVINDSDGVPLNYEEPEHVTSPRGAELQEYVMLEPQPHDRVEYFIKVTNHSATPQKFHLWTWGPAYPWFEERDRGYTIVSPSSADSCISVGAYVSRSGWTDYRGDKHSIAPAVGNLADFSSRGPRLDGLLKPDITAPGHSTISCFNHLINRDGSFEYLIMSNDGGVGEPADYFISAGTSMSCPATAAIAGLLLAARPNLAPWEVRNTLCSSARQDQFTGNVPNLLWGYGKVDIGRAMELAVGAQANGEMPEGFTVSALFPNPFNGMLNLTFKTLSNKPVLLKIRDIQGRDVYSKGWTDVSCPTFSVSMDFNSNQLPSGVYTLEVRQGTSVVNRNITLLR